MRSSERKLRLSPGLGSCGFNDPLSGTVHPSARQAHLWSCLSTPLENDKHLLYGHVWLMVSRINAADYSLRVSSLVKWETFNHVLNCLSCALELTLRQTLSNHRWFLVYCSTALAPVSQKLMEMLVMLYSITEGKCVHPGLTASAVHSPPWLLYKVLMTHSVAILCRQLLLSSM